MDGLGRQEEVVRRYIPVIPDQFRIYDSYTEDPKWQIRFTIIWTSVLAFTTIISIPLIYRQLRSHEHFRNLAITEDPCSHVERSSTTPSTRNEGLAGRTRHRLLAVLQSLAGRSIPLPRFALWRAKDDSYRRSYFSLSVGQIGAIATYIAISIVCFVAGAQLTQNANRPGFVALSQLPLIFLLSLKSPLPLPIFLPRMSYEHYNYLHRWTGRTLFLLVTVHGGLWLHQFISTNQMDQVWSDKSKRGMIAYGLICGIVLTSLKPIRRMFYQLFWVAHLTLFVGFLAAISYHTPYSRPWIYPCVAIYGYDFTVRMLRFRIKDALLVPIDSSMTMIHIPHCSAGWKPTQHVLLRVLAGSGVFESHPFTITTAPSEATSKNGIVLYARVCGDWTRKLHDLASDSAPDLGCSIEEQIAFLEKREAGHVVEQPGRRVLVSIDGPYGGLKIHLGDFGRVLVVAGGSGITFALGAIEEAVRISGMGSSLKEMEIVWVTPNMSAVDALGHTLLNLHQKARSVGLDLRYRIFLTRTSSSISLHTEFDNAASFETIRPDIISLVKESVLRATGQSFRDSETGPPASEVQSKGMTVIACGPEGIVKEAQDAVARMSIQDRVSVGGVTFHGEQYAL